MGCQVASLTARCRAESPQVHMARWSAPWFSSTASVSACPSSAAANSGV